jgi:methyl-accepting chemotaxis protein
MKIERKIMFAVGTTFLVFSAVMTVSLLAYSWVSFSEIKKIDRKTLYEQKTAQLQGEVDLAYGIALHHYNNTAIPDKERRKIAVDELSSLRYDNGAGSFFCLEKHGEGYVFAFNGEDGSLAGLKADTDATDADGKKYITEILESAGLKDSSVAFSQFEKGKAQAVRKIAYARRMSDWNWTIVGCIYVDDIERAITANEGRLDSILTRTIEGTAVLVGLMLLCSIFIIKRMAGGIVRPVNKISRSMSEFRDRKDLTMKMESASNDEVGAMSVSFNDFIAGVRLVVREIIVIAQELRGNSGGMIDLSRKFSGSACEQASDAEEVTASIEEVTAASESIAKNAEKQADELFYLSSEMKGISSSLRDLGARMHAADQLAMKMEEKSFEGQTALQNIHSAISELRNNSGQMNAIVALIMDISDKINLLSLNAAIESARAGDAGRGFAVVADQISKLADETSGSIKSIESLIRANGEKIVAAAEHASGAGSSFDVIRGSMSGMKDHIHEVSCFMGDFVGKNELMNEKVASVSDRASAIRSAMTDHMSAMAGITQATADITEKSGSIAENSRYLEDAAAALETCADRLTRKSGEFIV